MSYKNWQLLISTPSEILFIEWDLEKKIVLQAKRLI